MTDRLESAGLKLDRAIEHFALLRHEAGVFMSPQPYTLSPNVEVEGGWQLIRLHVKEEPPMRLAVIAGDVMGNINAALDHLVYALSITKPKGTGFPLFLSGDDYTRPKKDGSDRERLLAGVPDDDRAIIDAFQPYEREMRGDPLWLMREFTNTDKHRITHPAFARPRNIGFEHPTGCEVTLDTYYRPGPLHDGAVVARFRVDCADLPPDANVQVKAKVDLSIAFGTRGLDLVEIERMIGRATDYIGCF